MTDFLDELKQLFNTFQENELKHLKQRNKVHKSLLETLMENEFFSKEYIQQQFKRSKRFREETYYNFRGYPVKLNTTKEMRFNFQVKKRDINEKFSIDKLKSSPVKVKELVLFTQGSKTKTQFECWTPMEMFLWWRTLRESGEPKGEWKIMDAVFFLFINQLSQIINTYVINFKLNFYSKILEKYRNSNYYYYRKQYKINKYKNADDIFDQYSKSLFYLKQYLKKLDEFYLSGGKYGLLLDVQLLYYEYYEFELHLNKLRHENNNSASVLLLKKHNNSISNLNLKSVFFNNKSEINNYELKGIGYKIDKNHSTGKFKSYLARIKEEYTGHYDLEKFFAKTLEEDNFVLIIFQSYFQNPSKFISLYSIPIIPILGIEFGFGNHGGIYSSLHHVHHDLFHAVYLLYFLNNILYHPKFSKNSNEDIQEFFRRTVFLEELNKKALNKNNNEHSIYKDAQKLLWWIFMKKILVLMAVVHLIFVQVVLRNQINQKKP
jgi:hypothetical protein